MGWIPTSFYPLQIKPTMTQMIQPTQSPSSSSLTHHLLICTTCGSRWVNGQKEGTSQGEKLLEKLQSLTLNPQLKIKPIACMSGCSHACVVGLAAKQKTTYVFGDLDPDKDVDRIVATAELYLTKADGILPWGERPLKKGVIARIPPVE
ncbi:MAG: DUF1636 domain-containing protein [Thermostichus sp. DG02_1_bins_55]